MPKSSKIWNTLGESGNSIILAARHTPEAPIDLLLF